MGQIFGNIFGDEEEKKKGAAINVVQESTPLNKSAGAGQPIFGDIFAESDKIQKEAVSQTPQTVAAEPKGYFAKAVDAGKSVVKFGLDAINFVNRTAESAINLAAKPLAQTTFIKEAAAGLNAIEQGEVSPSTRALVGDALLKTLANPVKASLNTKQGKNTVEFISDNTSNLPLKGLAGLSALGDKTYEEAYGAWLAERNDPNNPTWQKFLYELQDTGVQSGIGILLTLGAAAAARNPQAGYAVSSAYYTALSADEQIKEYGEVKSTTNIAIDVVGDQLINKLLLGIIGNGSKGAIVEAIKGFGIEGSTEVTQSLLKYANDYGNARTEEEKAAVLANARNYVTSGGMALEFFVGGTIGAIAGGVTGATNSPANPAPISNKETTRPAAGEKNPTTAPVSAEIDGLDMNELRDKLVQLERTLDPNNASDTAVYTTMYDVLNDYATAFNDKTLYVPSATTEAPLIEVETVRFPDGKFAVRYGVNTQSNGFSAAYDFSQLFSSQEEATKDALTGIKAYVQTQLESATLEPEVRAEFEQILDFANGKRTTAVKNEFQDKNPRSIKDIDPSLSPADKARAVINIYIKGHAFPSPNGLSYWLDSNGLPKGVSAKAVKQLYNEEFSEFTKEVPSEGSQLDDSNKPAKNKANKEAENKTKLEDIAQLEGELRAAYAATGESELEGYTRADEVLSEIATAMELSQAGERIFLPHDATRTEDSVIGVPSTFPDWVPNELRSSKLFSQVLGSLEVSKLTYPKGNRTRQRRLYQTVLDELDAQLGIDTSDIRNKIIELYEKEETDSKDDNGGGAPKGDGGGGKGGKKSQKEVVEEAVKDKPKTIKEIAEETGILEPNVRRILGVGAKEGVFKRVDKGVYILSTEENGDIAFIYPEDAVETLPRLAKEGLKVDMVFLDIPYDTPAVKGGNRGVNYNLISVEQFRTIVQAVTDISRDESTPVFHMFSQAESGMKKMEQYNNVFLEFGYTPLARGEWQKTYKDGKPVGFPTAKGFQITKPEGIIVFNRSGKLKKDLKPLNFKLVRPNGYQTEKPEEMLKAMIEMGTDEGDVVLDPFAGSGSTGAAAVKAGRKTVLIEKNKETAANVTTPRVEKAIKETQAQRAEKMLRYQIGDTFEMVEPVHDLWKSKGNVLFIRDTRKRKGYINWLRSLNFILDAQEAGGNEVVRVTLDLSKDSLGTKTIEDDFKAPKNGNAFMPHAFDGDVWGALPEAGAAPLPERLGGITEINPIELPELVDITRELIGKVPQVTNRVLSKKEAYGVFMGDPMNPRIRILADLFAQNKLPEATKVLAHEMGHMIDWLPDKTMARGNLIGSLRSLRNFMSETFHPEDESKFSSKDRAKVRSEVQREVMAERDIKDAKQLTAEDKERIKKLYKARVEMYIENDGYIKNETIKQELLTVTRYWHPWDASKASPQYNKYRESARELYAEALSMLLVSPKRLSEMAPTFYKGFFDALDAKPEVRNTYFEVQALLSGDRNVLVERRREGVKRMFKEGDYKSIDLHNRRVAEKEARRARYWEHFKHTVIDKNFQIIDRVKAAKKAGKTINPDENPVYFLEERNYIGGKIKAVFERDFNTIYSTLNENEILWDDFGEVLFYERIAAGDRSDVANPRGITPAAATELLETVKKQYGEARWAIIQEQVSKFRAASKAITERAYEAGLYKPELYEAMQQNPAYVTFQVLDHLEDGMTSRVYKSLGTLKDISNPADSTMLKVITTIRAAERNKVTQATVEFLKAEFPNEIREAKYSGSKKGRFPVPSKKPEEELVTYFEKGVLKGYYVDPYIAETINNQSVGHNAPIVPAIRFMNSTLFRPLFIQFNLGFQTFNLIRDFWRFYKNTPTMSFARALKRYGQAGKIAKVRAFGLPKNPTQKDLEAQAMLERAEAEGVLSITFNDVISGRTEVDKQVEKILADTGIKEFQPKPTYEKVPRFAKPAVKALNKVGILDVTSNILGFIENLGNYIETLPKAAGVYEFQGTTEEFLSVEQKSFIRRKIGSPDFLAGGLYKPITNEVFLFSNAIIQGIRADIEVATEPQTRSGFWWKTAKVNFIPKMIMAAVLYGAFGDELKEMMEDVSEYDRSNYIIIPLGKDENNKTVYFRLPQDETGRYLSAMLWKVIGMNSNEQSVGRDLIDIASYTGGQLPSISPAIQATTATLQYISGQNPYDAFRGRQVLSDTVFAAGGAEANKAYAGWLFQQLGGGIFYRFYHEPQAPREQSEVERFFNLPLLGNVAGRFVRVSNYGQTEQLKEIEAKVKQEEARETLAERKIVNKYVEKAQEQNLKFNTAALEREMIREVFGGNPKNKEELQESERLVKKFKLQLKRGDASPEVTALIDANTNAQKIELLKQIRSESSDEEFASLRRDLISSGVVSVEVFEKLNLDTK